MQVSKKFYTELRRSHTWDSASNIPDRLRFPLDEDTNNWKIVCKAPGYLMCMVQDLVFTHCRVRKMCYIRFNTQIGSRTDPLSWTSHARPCHHPRILQAGHLSLRLTLCLDTTTSPMSCWRICRYQYALLLTRPIAVRQPYCHRLSLAQTVIPFDACTWGGLNMQMSSYQYKNPHLIDKTTLSLTWEYPYLGKTVFIFRHGPDSLTHGSAIPGTNCLSLITAGKCTTTLS